MHITLLCAEFCTLCAVNNAGCNVRKPTLEYTEGDYQKVMGTNLESAFVLSQVIDTQRSKYYEGISISAIGFSHSQGGIA